MTGPELCTLKSARRTVLHLGHCPLIDKAQTMLGLTAFSAASSSEGIGQYLEKGAIENGDLEDYYLKSGRVENEAPAEFYGSALARLGIEPGYDPVTFRRLLEGRDAEGQRLTEGRSNTRLPGWDLTFSAPKSVSLAWAVADAPVQKLIESAHDRAVKTALDYIERNITVANCGKGKMGFDGQLDVQRETANIAAALFLHGTSREGDPALHSHAIVFNAVERADGRIMSLNTRQIYTSKKELGAVYRIALAAELQNQGLRVERQKFSFELGELNHKKVLDAFSQRRAQIKIALDQRGLDSAKAANAAALATRGKGPQVSNDALKAQWRQRAAGFDITPTTVAQMQGPPQVRKAMPSFEQLLQQITEKQATFTERQARETIAIEAQGRVAVAEMEQYAQRFFSSENTHLVTLQDQGRFIYSSWEMVRVERTLLQAAKNIEARQQHQIKLKHVERAIQQFEKTHGFALNAEQREAVIHVTTKNGIALIQGYAGTGKSTLLAAANAAWTKAGLTVKGMALAGKAAAALKEAGLEAQTIAAALYAAERGDDFNAKDVIVVDEAGMVDSRTMSRLLDNANQAGAKVVLIGDTKQLQAIGAGGAFKALQNHFEVCTLKDIRRQQTELGKQVVQLTLNGQAGDALAKLYSAGKLHFSEDRQTALQTVIDRWSEHFNTQQLDGSVMLCQNHIGPCSS